MVTLTTGLLDGHKRYQQIVDFVLPKSTPDQYNEDMMEYFAKNSACIAVALDGENIVGTSLNFVLPADHSILTTLADYLIASGISNNDCVSPAAIFVDPAYTGQGIADKLTISKSQYALETNRTYAMAWGYSTQAIFDYNVRIGNLIETGAKDGMGFNIYLRTLQDTIDSLSAKLKQ